MDNITPNINMMFKQDSTMFNIICLFNNQLLKLDKIAVRARLGDAEYKSAESNIVIVTVQTPPTIVVSATATPASIYSGGTSKIRATLTSGGVALIGSTLNIVSSNGGSFSSVTDNGNGTYAATFTAPEISSQIKCTITVSAQKGGYTAGTAQAQLDIQPLVLKFSVKGDDGSPISGVTLVSTSQPSSQSTLSGTTDENGLVSFSNVQKGSYTIKASKSSYVDKTLDFSVQLGQVTTQTLTLEKQQGGVPGYPAISILLAILAASIVLFKIRSRNSHIRILGSSSQPL